jgi:hypothetical protein
VSERTGMHRTRLVACSLLACVALPACATGAFRGAPDDASIPDASLTDASTPDASMPDADVTCGPFELCNGVLDTCGDVIDDGCPTGVSPGTATSCECSYGGSGGSPSTPACASGSALVGFDGSASASMYRLRPACAPLSMSALPGSPEGTFVVQTGAVTLLAQAGADDGDDFSDRCATNEVVIGIAGGTSDELEGFRFICGSITIARSGPGGPWLISVERTTTSPYRGDTDETQFEYVCPTGSVATVIPLRSGDRIDQVSLSCSPVTLQTI